MPCWYTMSGTMLPKTLTFATVVAVLLAVLPEARGILCYQCNSKRESGCEVLAPAPSNGTARYLLPCDDGPDGEPAFCRKSIIEVRAANNGEGEQRWVRACGWVKHKNECYQFDDDDHHETVCQCFTDGCNGAPGLQGGRPAAHLLQALALAALLLALQAWR